MLLDRFPSSCKACSSKTTLGRMSKSGTGREGVRGRIYCYLLVGMSHFGVFYLVGLCCMQCNSNKGRNNWINNAVHLRTGNFTQHEVEKQFGANVPCILNIPQKQGMFHDAFNPECGSLRTGCYHQLVICHCEIAASLTTRAII